MAVDLLVLGHCHGRGFIADHFVSLSFAWGQALIVHRADV
jgi:hypothetical protein